MGVRGRVLDEGELDREEGIEDGGGEEDKDMKVEESEECGCSMNGSDSNCKQRSLEWQDSINGILELKKLGERGLRGGVSRISKSCGLALPITTGDILARPPSVTARKRRPHPLAHNPDVRCDRGHPRSYAKQKKEKKGRNRGKMQ